MKLEVSEALQCAQRLEAVFSEAMTDDVDRIKELGHELVSKDLPYILDAEKVLQRRGDKIPPEVQLVFDAANTVMASLLEELQLDLEIWLDYYNKERTHQGKKCCGRAPMQTFLEDMPVVHENFITTNYRDFGLEDKMNTESNFNNI